MIAHSLYNPKPFNTDLLLLELSTAFAAHSFAGCAFGENTVYVYFNGETAPSLEEIAAILDAHNPLNETPSQTRRRIAAELRPAVEALLTKEGEYTHAEVRTIAKWAAAVLCS